MSRPFLAGTGRVDITPVPGTPQGGWGAQTHPRGTHADMPFYATALALGKSENVALIIDVDAIGFDREWTGRIIDAVASVTGLDQWRIRLSCTHTHSGPNTFRLANISEGLDMVLAYLESLPLRIAGAAWQAIQNLEPARIGSRRGECAVNACRRVRAGNRVVVGSDPDAPADRSLRVVRIDSLERRPIAVLMHYACHGTTIAWQSTAFTPDFPGPARAVVEHHLGGRCLFLQGAAADLGPREGFTGDLDVYRRLGLELGLAAAHLAVSIETQPRRRSVDRVIRSGADIALYTYELEESPASAFRVMTRDAALPIREFRPLEELEAELAELRSQAHRLKDEGRIEEFSVANALATQMGWRAGNARTYRGQSETAWTMHAVSIGNIALAGVPGEPFSSIGQAVARESPFAETLFSGYSNGGFGYIPDEAAYREGGYEIEATPFAEGAGERLTAEVLRLLTDLKNYETA
ncbi:MAG: hypothetical protein KJZ78_20215 [Bryobacteraceae bacterium]|nr:hypothetical protein [Bryobacteraceae bacterium]